MLFPEWGTYHNISQNWRSLQITTRENEYIWKKYMKTLPDTSWTCGVKRKTETMFQSRWVKFYSLFHFLFCYFGMNLILWVMTCNTKCTLDILCIALCKKSKRKESSKKLLKKYEECQNKIEEKICKKKE